MAPPPPRAIGTSAGKMTAAGRAAAAAGRFREALARVRPGDSASLFASVRAFALFSESPGHHSYGHSERVATYALEMAAALGLDGALCDAVRLGAYLHDVGTLRLPTEILYKERPLTTTEFGMVKKHPEWGVEILDGIRLPSAVPAIVHWHHEKADGTGYPDALKADGIPVSASLVGLAEVLDAVTTRRSYRPGISGVAARKVMHDRRGWWLPDVYRAFGRVASGATRVAAALRGSRGTSRTGTR